MHTNREGILYSYNKITISRINAKINKDQQQHKIMRNKKILFLNMFFMYFIYITRVTPIIKTSTNRYRIKIIEYLFVYYL